jgi:sensor histidine kinase YesM
LRVERGGLGLENVRKRLDLIFGDDYDLQLDDSRADEYRVKLSIPIIYDKVHSH